MTELNQKRQYIYARYDKHDDCWHVYTASANTGHSNCVATVKTECKAIAITQGFINAGFYFNGVDEIDAC